MVWGGIEKNIRVKILVSECICYVIEKNLKKKLFLELDKVFFIKCEFWIFDEVEFFYFLWNNSDFWY